MPTVPDFGFCGPAYQAITPLLDAQDCLNLYPEPGIARSKGPMALIGTPGLSLFTTLPHGPVRGLFAGNARLFAVGGTHVYEVSNTGTIITDFGAIPGATTGPVRMVANGNDLAVMDSSVAQVWIAAGGTLTLGIAAFDIDYLDTFYFALADTPVNQVNQSASLDGTTWPVLNFAVRTGTPDFLTAIAVINNQVWLLGQKNTEIWYNAGNPGFVLQRGSGAATINQGCSNRNSVIKIDNTIQWLGGDDRGPNVVYQASGQTPKRISNYAVEQLMGGYSVVGEGTLGPGNVRCFAYQEDGHLFNVMNFNGANGGVGATLAYDCTTGFWHRRGYLNPGSGVIERIRADCFASVPQFLPGGLTGNFVGDYVNGNIYIQSLSTASDNGDPIKRIRTTPHVADRDFWYTYPSLRVDADCGTATATLELSDNGGKTFRSAAGGAIPTITPPSTNDLPYYQWLQLGRSRDRVFRFSTTSSTQLIRLQGAYLNANKGQEV